MTKMADRVSELLPEGYGFALFVFPFHDLGIGNYISNADRKDMIAVMRDVIERMERHEDLDLPETSMN